jgi:hypothetical protein
MEEMRPLIEVEALVVMEKMLSRMYALEHVDKMDFQVEMEDSEDEGLSFYEGYEDE